MLVFHSMVPQDSHGHWHVEIAVSCNILPNSGILKVAFGGGKMVPQLTVYFSCRGSPFESHVH